MGAYWSWHIRASICLTAISHDAVCVLSAGISMKLGTNVHHVSAHCWKRFQGQRSKVKVMTRPVNFCWRRHTFWQCSVEVCLFWFLPLVVLSSLSVPCNQLSTKWPTVISCVEWKGRSTVLTAHPSISLTACSATLWLVCGRVNTVSSVLVFFNFICCAASFFWLKFLSRDALDDV